MVRLTFDEKPCQLLGQKVEPLAAKPGSIKKVDHEYVRQGTANILLAYDVEAGIRHAQVRKQRTRRDFAECIHQLVTEQYAAAERVEILLDNLNTHTTVPFMST